MTQTTKVIATGMVTTLVLLVLFCLGEVALRLWHLKKYGFDRSGRIHAGHTIFDETLGWKAATDYREQVEGHTAGGQVYLINRSQNEWGFRLFGDLDSRRTKILVLGDSFTQAIDASDNKTYYSVLQTLMNADVFAYGVGGYGTLQEYMILNEFIDLIKPDVLLWQYCSNDFINNDPILELMSRENNNGRRRPYWVNKQIVYQIPKESLVPVRDWAYRHSRFLTMLFSRWDKLHALAPSGTVEGIIEQQDGHVEAFARALEVTDDLMGMVRARVGNLPIVAVSCNAREPYTEAFTQISSHHGITFLGDAAEAMQAANNRGDDVLAADRAHLNELGHEVFGRTIAVHLSELLVGTHPVGLQRHALRSGMPWAEKER